VPGAGTNLSGGYDLRQSNQSDTEFHRVHTGFHSEGKIFRSALNVPAGWAATRTGRC
jgi:hypothetical protein